MEWRSEQPDAATARLHSLDEVAALCSVSKRTVQRWIDDDGLPIHRIPGAGARGIVRIAESDLTEWLSQFRKRAADKADRPVLRLNGRRFTKNPSDSPENGLDHRSSPRSRVPAAEAQR